MPQPVVCPWFVVPLSESLRAAFALLADELGCRRESFGPREIIQRESERYENMRFIVSGVVSQAVINRRLSKPLAMNLYPEGALAGFINLFTGVASPRLMVCESASEIVSIPTKSLRSVLKERPDLAFAFAAHCELAAKSELIGMEALFSLPLESRLRLFFAAALLWHGINPLEVEGEYLEVPASVTRASLGRIIYASKVSLDRLFAESLKSGMIAGTPKKRLVRRLDIESEARWILER